MEIFGEHYLKATYITILLHIGEQRGFSTMLGSFNYMHWELKNWPVGWSADIVVVVDL